MLKSNRTRLNCVLGLGCIRSVKSSGNWPHNNWDSYRILGPSW
ncbi:hypothetical protein DAI22_11g188401 [Oryza sativa Japonica Group]|nr:hypothetical protein DAI22_11g188401 [Oryza sativa Japonica Group]